MKTIRWSASPKMDENRIKRGLKYILHENCPQRILKVNNIFVWDIVESLNGQYLDIFKEYMK